jgi:hypothetical protein
MYSRVSGVALAAAVLLLLAGCAGRTAGPISLTPGRARQRSHLNPVSVVQTAPPPAGAKGAWLSGVLSDAGSENVSGSDTPSSTHYTVTLQWGPRSRPNDSDVLVGASTRLYLNGQRGASMTPADIVRAIDRYMAAPGNVPTVTVSYETSANAPLSSSADPGYRLSVATEIRIGPR